MAENPTNEQPDLEKGIVFVAERGGVIVGFTAAQPIWRVEPMLLFPEFKKSKAVPQHAKRRATYLLIQAAERWIADRQQNVSGIHGYFCFILDRTLQKLAGSFGMHKIRTGGRFFGRAT